MNSTENKPVTGENMLRGLVHHPVLNSAGDRHEEATQAQANAIYKAIYLFHVANHHQSQ